MTWTSGGLHVLWIEWRIVGEVVCDVRWSSTLMSKLQSKRLMSTMKALERLSLRGGGSIGTQAFSGRAPIRKPCGHQTKLCQQTTRPNSTLCWGEHTLVCSSGVYNMLCVAQCRSTPRVFGLLGHEHHQAWGGRMTEDTRDTWKTPFSSMTGTLHNWTFMNISSAVLSQK